MAGAGRGPPGRVRPALAGSLSNQSLRWAALGRREEALAASTEAVNMWRELAGARPDAFRPNLAGSLTNQSLRWADLGRREKALTASTEAVNMWRELAKQHPFFRESLAASLTSLRIRLTELGDHGAALSAEREAVSLYVVLLPLDPVRYRESLEQAVKNLAIDLRDLGYSEQEIANELAGLSLPDAD